MLDNEIVMIENRDSERKDWVCVFKPASHLSPVRVPITPWKVVTVALQSLSVLVSIIICLIGIVFWAINHAYHTDQYLPLVLISFLIALIALFIAFEI